MRNKDRTLKRAGMRIISDREHYSHPPKERQSFTNISVGFWLSIFLRVTIKKCIILQSDLIWSSPLVLDETASCFRMNHDETTRILETNQPTVDKKKRTCPLPFPLSPSFSNFSNHSPFNQATTNIKLGIQLPINENAGSLPSAMGLPSHAAVNSVSLSQRKKLSEDRSESHQILLEGDLLWFHCDFMWPFITPTWDTRSRSPGDLDAAGQETSSFLATVVPTSCPNGAALSLQDTLHGFDWICMEAFMKFSFNGFSGRFWVSFWESLDNADLGWRRTGCIPKKKSTILLVFCIFQMFSMPPLTQQTRQSEILHKFWTRWDSTIDGYRPPGPVSKGKFTEESIVGSKKIEFTSSHPSNIKYTP